MSGLILTPNPLIISSPIFDLSSPSLEIDAISVLNSSGDAKFFMSPTFNVPGQIVPPMMMNAKMMDVPLGSGLILSRDIVIPSFKLLLPKSYRTPLSVYDDVCDTAPIKEDIVKIFYYKFLDKWLYDKDASMPLLKYLKVSGDKVELVSKVKSSEDYLKNDQKTIDKKVEFIEKNLLSIEEVYEILKKFVAETRVSWCDLTKFKTFVREAIEKSLKKKIKRIIED